MLTGVCSDVSKASVIYRVIPATAIDIVKNTRIHRRPFFSKVTLVAVVAICGDLVPDPSNRDDIASKTSRLFQHLLPDYTEEFPHDLKEYVWQSVSLQHSIPESEQEFYRSCQSEA